MKVLAYLSLVLGLLSLIVGIISRFTLQPLAFIPGGLESHALLSFTNTCLLLTVVCLLIQKVNTK